MKLRANLEFKFIISLVFAVIVAVFAIQNAGSIEVRFFFANFRVSQAVVILGSAIVGAIIVLILGLVKQVKHNKKVKQLIQEVESLKIENTNLKASLDNFHLVENEDVEVYELEKPLIEEELVDEKLEIQ